MNSRFLTFILIAFVAVAVIFGIAGYMSSVNAAGGPPPHSHDGYPLCKLSPKCNDVYARHAQQELNWLDTNLLGFDIVGGPLVADGDFGSKTANAVTDFQKWVKNNWGDAGMLTDGKIGNQTWTHMEFQVMNATALATSATLRHPAGLKLRYPVLGDCRAITNNSGTYDMAGTIRTPAEWSAFKASPKTTNAASNCDPSGGGGTGGGSCIPAYGNCESRPYSCCSGRNDCWGDEVGGWLCKWY